jgi:outer membrane protein insertion porin family
MGKQNYPLPAACGIRLLAELLVTLLCLIGPLTGVAQTPETQTFRLNKIEVKGLQKVSREKFLELGGLKLDQNIKVADFKEVVNRLYATGLFERVKYQYSWMDESLEVVFDVEERKPTPQVSATAGAAKASSLALGKIEFSGLNHCDQATAVKAAGLQLGAVIDPKQLSAATRRLIDTGYFSDVNYLYREVDGQMVAQFEVTEIKWDVELVFDNFVWFTPQELRDAVRKEIPGFDGSLPDSDIISRKIKGILEEMLRRNGIPRSVDFIVSVGDLYSPTAKIQKGFVFIATGAPMPVCKVSFPGASPALEKLLQAGVKPLLNVDYSSQQLQQYIENTLAPIYHQRGRLRAKFASVSTQWGAGTNKKCEAGVNVSIPVEEGSVYKLGKFEWVGNQAMAMATMRDLLGMKTGAPADGEKINRGLNAIKTAYFNQGYLDLKLTAETEYDERAGTANYRVVVEEGKPYKMGAIVIMNASENEQNRIRSRWRLAQGTVFNVLYLQEFIKKLSEDRAARTPRVRLQSDSAKQTVTVTFTFMPENN